MREIVRNKTISRNIKNETYSNILFEELMIRCTKVLNTKFINSHFKHFKLGSKTIYKNCRFEKCKFFGKYSSFGYKSKFINCDFIDCNITGSMQFTGVSFYSCKFGGLIKNVIINDLKYGFFKNKTGPVFNKCDFSEVIFDNLSLYGKFGLSYCKLPKKGIRKYKNDNDSLINKANEICSGLSGQDKIESEIIFKPDLKTGQNPIILDDIFLDSFFKSTASRELFEKIVSGFEF